MGIFKCFVQWVLIIVYTALVLKFFVEGMKILLDPKARLRKKVAVIALAILSLLLFFLLILLEPSEAHAAELQSDTWGYTHIVCEEPGRCDATKARARSTVNFATDTRMFIEVEGAHAQKNGANHIQQIWVMKKVGQWDLLVGRLFLSAATNNPPPFNLETAKFSRSPFEPYAYGLQVRGEIGKGLPASFDFTGSSVGNYRDLNASRWESSCRVEKKWNGKLSTNFYGSVSPDFQRGSIVTIVRVKKVAGRAGIYRAGEELKPDFSGEYLFLERLVTPSVFVHAQIDHRQQSKLDSTVSTIGVRLSDKKGINTLIVDREMPNHGSGKTVIRFQRKFFF